MTYEITSMDWPASIRGTYTPGDSGPGAVTDPQYATSELEFIAEAFVLEGQASDVIRPPWMPTELWVIWLEGYIEAGGAGNPNAEALATAGMRSDPSYDEYFPGNRRDDGSLRLDEATYFNNMAAFRETVEGLNINPDLFGDEYVALIEGDVSPAEFGQRANALYDRVINQGDAIREWYARIQGIDMTTSAILASLMSENVENAILNREITMAEIGGEAAMRNFDLAEQFVEALAASGVDRGEAQALFGSAERMVPLLTRMAARHGDPDDDFDIYEFVEAEEFQNAQQVNRMMRLQAQEASSFTGGAAIDIRRSQQGGLTGLTEI